MALRRVVLIAIALLLPIPVFGQAPSPLIADPPGRVTQSLDGLWNIIVDPYETGLGGRFYQNRKPASKSDLVEYDFDASPNVHVPGDWNTQSEKLLLYEGPVWYKKSFQWHGQSGRRVFLYFGAANYFTRVYLNGKELGSHEGGFTPFDFEVTDILKDGENFVVAEVNDQRRADGVPSLNTDWWNYGGITRDVSLIEVPGTFIENFFVQLAKGSQSEIAAWVQLNSGSAAKPGERVTIDIPEAHVSQSAETDAKGRAEFHFSAKLDLWSPEKPRLYQVKISAGDDTVADEIGFRTIETRGTQILLNGKPIFLRGISMHEEAPFRSGRAFSEEDERTLLGWAHELGCNFIRDAHYPHNEHVSRMADKMGILLWEEIPVYWSIDWENPATLQNAENQMRDLIARDQNRASVALWSLSNETPNTPARVTFLRNFANYTRSQDSTRLITSALNTLDHSVEGAATMSDPICDFLDVLGINEYYGWYWGKIDSVDQLKWTVHWQKPVIISEFGAGAPAGNHGDPDARFTEEYQASLYDHHLAMIRRLPFVAGMSPWVLMDFRSPRRTLPQIQDGYNRKGLVSDRGQKKLAFFTLQKFYREMAASVQ